MVQRAGGVKLLKTLMPKLYRDSGFEQRSLLRSLITLISDSVPVTIKVESMVESCYVLMM